MDVKLLGGGSGICIRGRPDSFQDCPGYHIGMGEGIWGCLWEEGGRGRVSGYDQTYADLLVHKEDWNRFRICVEGPHLQVWLNGVNTLDVVEERGASSGVIGLLLPPGEGQKTEAFFRNIYLYKISRRRPGTGTGR